MKTKSLLILLIITGCFFLLFLQIHSKKSAMFNAPLQKQTNIKGGESGPYFEEKNSSLESRQAKEQLMKNTNQIAPPAGESISEQQARIIASKAVESVSYDKDAGISIHREAGCYVVTFPIKKPELQPGERYRGAPYAAKVVVDEKTGKVVQVKVGS